MRIVLFFAGMVCSLILSAQNAITVTKWIGGVAVPVDIAHCGDDRVFIIEKAGKIRIVENNQLLTTPFLDIVSKVRSSGNEQGLLGMAFHPDYNTNGYFYVNYTNRATPTLTVIERYQVTSNKNKADSLSGQIIMTFAQPYANHNGGCLKFGKDGYLYIGTGDGGSGGDPQNNAQNKKVMLGKMMRIDIDTAVSYKIPPSNPFIKDTSYLKEIWAVGLRNPWRYTFDRLTGDLWIGDVGQDTWEEIDFDSVNSKGGHNYGWRCYEGNHDYNTTGCSAKSNFTFPLHEYLSDQNSNGCSITGGYVYRGDNYPSLYGKYIYCDYCSGKIWLLERISDTSYVNTLAYNYTDNVITTFGEDYNGNIYFADAGTSSIYRIGDTCRFSFNMITTDPSCAGLADGTAKTNLQSGIAAQFIWSTGDTLPELKNLDAGNYTLKVIYNKCLYQSQFTIQSKPKDTACIVSPEFFKQPCEGDTIPVRLCEKVNALKFQWYKNGIEIIGQQDSILLVTENGSYQLKYTDSTGCESTLSNVEVITFQPRTTAAVLMIQNDTLYATPNHDHYYWYLNGVLIDATTVPFYKVAVNGKYQVEVADSNKCPASLSNEVVYLVIKTNDIEDSGVFKLRPNPVIDYLIVESKQMQNLTNINYQIISNQNQEILSSRFTNFKDSLRIDVSHLMPGMYWIQIQSGKQKEKLPFIKIRQ